MLKLFLLVFIPLIYTQCLPGNYQNTLGVCTPCPPGTFSSTGRVGISSCQLCPTGTFQRLQGSQNCTKCDEGSLCPTGTSFGIKSSDLETKILDPSTPFIVQNFKIGFVFVAFLLFVVPLIAFCLTCWSDSLCGFFDWADGEARIKRKTACGGFCFLFALALFTMVAGAVIVDFYWNSVVRVGKIAPSLQVTRQYPFGVNQNQRVELKIIGVNVTDCVANYPTTSGYIVGVGGNLNITTTHSANDQVCDVVMNCRNCSLSQSQTLSITLPRERIFASRIFYTYSVSHFGEWYSLNGSLAAPSGQVFSGSTPSVISLTLFASYLHFLNGGQHGGAQWTQWVDTFVRDVRSLYHGLAFQVETISLGSTSQNLTGQGVTIQFNGAFSGFDYIVDEILLQTVWDHVAELVSLCLLFLVIGYLLLNLWEYLVSIYEFHEKNGNVTRVKKAFIRPFRALWRWFLNLFKQEKEDVWKTESESDEEKEELEDEEKKVPEDTEEVLERLKKQIVELEGRVGKKNPDEVPVEEKNKKEVPVEEKIKKEENKRESKREVPVEERIKIEEPKKTTEGNLIELQDQPIQVQDSNAPENK